MLTRLSVATRQENSVRQRRPGFLVFTVGCVLASVLTACGSSGGSEGRGSSGGGSGADSAAAAAALGPLHKAAGTPVKLGFDSVGVTDAQDYSDEIKAVKAAVAYANDHLGGIGGHPIQLFVCQDHETPAGATDCGNQFVSQKVSAVAMGSPGQLDAVLKVLVPAGIPAAVNAGSTQLALTSPGVFVLNNGVTAFGTPALYAREHKLKKAAVLILDVPSAVGPAKALLPGLFARAGSSAKIYPVPAGTADMTPQLQTAAQGKPDLYYVIGDPNFCLSALKAVKTLGVSGKVLVLDRCIADTQSSSLPGGYAGIDAVAQAVTNPGDKEYKLFDAILNKYAGKNVDRNRSLNGYQGMLGLIRAVNASKTTDLSPKGIRAALQTMPPTPYPLGGGATFQCDGKAIPGISKNICLNAGFIATADKSGTLSHFTALKADGLYNPS